jgi:hypothetical protein
VSLLAAILSCSCYRQCKDKELMSYYYLPTMENYFGVYKPGNWWIYENLSDTVIDCLYVSDYSERTDEIRIPYCYSYPVREFKLNTNHLLQDESSIDVNYEHMNCCQDFIGFHSVLSIHMDGQHDAHPKSSTDVGEILFDSLSINNISYHDVLYITSTNNIQTYFAPNVGLIRYITPQNDNFSIKNYHIE